MSDTPTDSTQHDWGGDLEMTNVEVVMLELPEAVLLKLDQLENAEKHCSSMPFREYVRQWVNTTRELVHDHTAPARDRSHYIACPIHGPHQPVIDGKCCWRGVMHAAQPEE